MTAFQFLQTFDIVLVVRPSKRCTYSRRTSQAILTVQVNLSMAFAFTCVLANLKQLMSLSIRFDSETLSDRITCDFLAVLQISTLLRFRLENAWVWTPATNSALVEFVRSNKQVQHLHFAHVDLDDGCWAALLGTLKTECEALQSLELRSVSEEGCAVLFNDNDRICIETTREMMSAKLDQAQRELNVSHEELDIAAFGRYERYQDDWDYDSAEG